MKIDKLYRLPTEFEFECKEFSKKHSIEEEVLIDFVLQNLNDFVDRYEVKDYYDESSRKQRYYLV